MTLARGAVSRDPQPVNRARRGTLVLLALAAIPAGAQPESRIRKIGLLWNSLPQGDLDRGVAAHPGPRLIEDALRKLGWERGKNIEILSKSAESRYERMPGLVDEFVRLPVDVLVVFGPEGARAAQESTRTIPIVWAGSYVITPQARPHDNVTGISYVLGTPGLKRLELLKELVPRTTRVAILTLMRSAEGADSAVDPRDVDDAKKLGLHIFRVFVASPAGFDRAFAQAMNEGANAVYVPVFPEITWSRSVQSHVLSLAARYKVPAIYETPELARHGALLAYGVDDTVGNQRAAYFIDRLLRGAKPSDLPVERADKFRLAINRRTARELGIEIPPSLLILADNVFD
jgi:putative ABC transport system substrate-binding protein